MDIGAFLGALSGITADWALFGAIAVITGFDTFRSGTGRASAFILALPLVMLFSALLPEAAFLGSVSSMAIPFAPAVIFGAITVCSYLLLRRMDNSYGTGGSILASVLTGLAVAITLMVIWLEVPALSSVWNFGSEIRGIFADAYRFWWMIVSLGLLAFVRR